MIILYIHKKKDWPNFKWDHKIVSTLLADARYLQGNLIGMVQAFGFGINNSVILQTLTQDVIKTSEIEGEKLDDNQVRSSVASRLGIDIGGILPVNRNVEGIVEIMVDATQNYNNFLTKERLCNWHNALFPISKTKFQKIVKGNWRGESSGAMQVVSGSHGREKIHFEAPLYDRLEFEMDRFLSWYNDNSDVDLVIKAAVAHFWFITIHPFDDGNGRIARAITDMMLARSEKTGKRFYSMSAQIQKDRKAYYDILENCQKATLDITLWLEWFLNCFKKSILASEELIESVSFKARFWEKHIDASLNDRQRFMINKILDGFDGKLTSSKWALITKSSQDTALRDINDLVQRGILVKEDSGGRSTGYNLPTNPALINLGVEK